MRAALCLVLLTVMAACGTGPADQPVVLHVLMADDWADTAPVIDVVRAFERDRPGVRVDLVGRPFSQIEDELAASIAAGTPIDVVQSHAFAAGARELAEPLDDVWAEHLDPNRYFPGAVADVTWGATRYGVPLDINAMVMVLDAELATATGPPRTVAEVRDYASAARAAGIRGLTVTSDAWVTYGWIRAHGGEIVEVGPDGEPTFTLDRPENVRALDFLAELVADGLAYGPTTRNVAADAFALFGAGDTAMLLTGTWDLATLARSRPDRAVVTAPMPGTGAPGPAGSALGGSSLLIGTGSAHRDLAVEFILALTADDPALELARTEGRLPPTPDLLRRAGLDPEVHRTLATQLATAHPQRLIAFPEVQAAFARAIDEVLTGRSAAAEALVAAQRVATMQGAAR